MFGKINGYNANAFEKSKKLIESFLTKNVGT